MLPAFIRIIVIIATTTAFILWITAMQRKLIMLDENVSYAMDQVGVQLTSRLDSLIVLAYMIKNYVGQESESILESIKSGRCLITAGSKPEEVVDQERLISEALNRILIISEKHPELRADKSFINTMDVIKDYENMIGTSIMLYNRSVARFNRETQKFPVSLIAAVLCNRKREYIEE